MDITEMNFDEVSNKLKPYIIEHFGESREINFNDNLFSESFSFDFEEVRHNIPEKYHHLFKKTDVLHGSSGYLIFNDSTEEENEYIISLLTDEDCTKAYFLLLQIIDSSNNQEELIILKDFL